MAQPLERGVVGDDRGRVGELDLGPGVGGQPADSRNRVAEEVFVDVIQRQAVGQLGPGREHSWAAAGDPDRDVWRAVTHPGPIELEQLAVEHGRFALEQRPAHGDRLSQHGVRPLPFDAHGVERETASRAQAEEHPAGGQLIERSDGRGGEARMAGVGIGDAGPELDSIGRERDDRQADVELAHGRALVVQPASTEAAPLRLLRQLGHPVRRSIGQQVHAPTGERILRIHAKTVAVTDRVLLRTRGLTAPPTVGKRFIRLRTPESR